MDVTSWLRTRFARDNSELMRAQAETAEALFKNQELMKCLGRAREQLHESESRYKIAIEQLSKAHEDIGSLESEIASTEEAKVLAVAQLETLKGEVQYLRDQIEIYQRRLGLLPQERQSQTEATQHKPLRTAREPFAVAAARIQSQRTEEYWRQKANAANIEGVTGTTTENSPTVSEKES